MCYFHRLNFKYIGVDILSDGGKKNKYTRSLTYDVDTFFYFYLFIPPPLPHRNWLHHREP